jgi:hypothetical protein
VKNHVDVLDWGDFNRKNLERSKINAEWIQASFQSADKSEIGL